MKTFLITLITLILLSCNKKVDFSELKNEDETYLRDGEPYTGEAFFGIDSETPSTRYELYDGRINIKTEFFPESDKIKTNETFSMGYLQRTDKYAKDGMLLEKQNYVWNDSRDTINVYVEWYDWCGKMKRRKSMKCDKSFHVVEDIFDQEIPEPCK